LAAIGARIVIYLSSSKALMRGAVNRFPEKIGQKNDIFYNDKMTFFVIVNTEKQSRIKELGYGTPRAMGLEALIRGIAKNLKNGIFFIEESLLSGLNEKKTK
jgi:hypothetical protein